MSLAPVVARSTHLVPEGALPNVKSLVGELSLLATQSSLGAVTTTFGADGRSMELTLSCPSPETFEQALPVLGPALARLDAAAKLDALHVTGDVSSEVQAVLRTLGRVQFAARS